MLPSQSSNLKNISEFREPIKDFIKILVLKAVVFTIVRRDLSEVILVYNLKNETNISKVTAFFKDYKSMRHVFIVNFD